MIDELRGAGYRGPDRRAREPRLRPRPRAVVRHRRPVVEARHLARGAGRGARAGRRPPSCRSSRCTRTSAPGPRSSEFDANMRQLVELLRRSCCPQFPDVEAVNLGGGIPHPYRPGRRRATTSPATGRCCSRRPSGWRAAAGRPIRVEIEPGRYPVAGTGLLVCRVKDIKQTATNDKGPGQTVRHGRRRLQRPGPPGDVRRRTTTSRSSAHGAGRAARAVRRGRTAVRERRRVHPRRPRAARPAPAAAAPSWATCWCCTTPAPTARR